MREFLTSPSPLQWPLLWRTFTPLPSLEFLVQSLGNIWSVIFKPDRSCNISFILCLKIRSQDSKGPGASRIQTVRGPPGEAVSSGPLVLVAELLLTLFKLISINYV